MDITHPGQQLIFYLDVFVDFVLFLSFRAFCFVFVVGWNPQTSAPITSGTHTDGGAVIG